MRARRVFVVALLVGPAIVPMWSRVPDARAAIVVPGGYVEYIPGNWDGTFSSYAYQTYRLEFLGMHYVGGGGYCQWASCANDGGQINNCTLASDLVTLADNLHATNPYQTYTLYVSPTDCMAGYNGQSVATAASVLNGTVNYPNVNGPGNVTTFPIMDAEDYWPNGSVCPQGWNSPSQFPNTDAFFSDYYGDGGVVRIIGPAGSAPITASQEQQLATDGDGSANPLIFAPRNAQDNWPTSISTGYYGITTDANGGSGYYTTVCAAIDDWTSYTRSPPGYDYDFNQPALSYSC